MGLVGREWIVIRAVLSLYAYSGLEFANAWSESTSRLVGNDRGGVDVLFVHAIDDPLAIAGQTLFATSKSNVRMDCRRILLGVLNSFASSDLFSDAADPAGVVGLDQARDHNPQHAPFLHGDLFGIR